MIIVLLFGLESGTYISQLILLGYYTSLNKIDLSK